MMENERWGWIITASARFLSLLAVWQICHIIMLENNTKEELNGAISRRIL